MCANPTVFKHHPTTSVPPEEIALLSDQELVDYCEVHCWTPQAQFDRETVRRLFALAGTRVTGDTMPAWITVRPVIMNALVRAARNGLSMRRLGARC